MSRIPKGQKTALTIPQGTKLKVTPEVTASILIKEVGVSGSIALATEFGPYIVDVVAIVTPVDGYAEYETLDAQYYESNQYSGFMDYNDTSTGTTPINLLAGVWTDIPNDGLGLFTNKFYKPDGVVELMDTSTGYLDPTGLPLGLTLFIRNDYSIVPTTNNAKQEFRYVLGNGGGEYTLEKTLGRLDSGAGNIYRSSLETDLIYMGDLNTRDNPIKLQVKMSTDATLTNAGSVIVAK